jgi:hypothetical protein
LIDSSNETTLFHLQIKWNAEHVWRVCKDYTVSVVTYFMASRNSPEQTEEKHETSQSGQLITSPIFETGTSRTRYRSTAVLGNNLEVRLDKHPIKINLRQWFYNFIQMTLLILNLF